jgi:hypothetical protein
MQKIYRVYLLLFFSFLFFQSTKLIAQNSSFAQFRPEIDITTKPFKKTTLQLDLYSQRESDENGTNMFQHPSNIGGKFWVNHYFKSKVKSSAFIETIYNKPIPEANSGASYEYRIGLQNTYTMPAGRFTFSHAIRIEDRIIKDNADHYINALRPRYKLKMIVGLNKKYLIKGALYFIATNEVFFNLGSSVTGYHFFEQDAVELGLGYCLTDYITLESLYVYNYKRFAYSANGVANIQAWQLTLSFNNVFSGGYFKGYFHKK